MREFGGSLDSDDREEVRSTLNRARKAVTVEERSVLEEAIGAVQNASRILTEVIMMDPMTALGMANIAAPDGDESDEEK